MKTIYFVICDKESLNKQLCDFEFMHSDIVIREEDDVDFAKFEKKLKAKKSVAFLTNHMDRSKFIEVAKNYGYKISTYILQDVDLSLKDGFDEIFIYKNGKLFDHKLKVLIATKNQGKIAIYANVLKELGLDFCSLKDLDVDIEVEENGKDESENAYLKAKAYHEATGLPVISNDSGLIIEKFKPEDQPGVFVRRYGGRELTDQETIDIFAKKLDEVGGESDSYFKVALCVCDNNGKYHHGEFKSYRYMISKPSKVIQKGLPLRSLDYNKEFGMYMSEMTIEQANKSEGKCIEDQTEFIKNIFSRCNTYDKIINK